MFHSTSAVLFESTDAPAVLEDPANADWLAVVAGVDGVLFDLVARRYYLALADYRRASGGTTVPDRLELFAEDMKAAERQLLEKLEARKAASKAPIGACSEPAVLAETRASAEDLSRHEALRDFSVVPPTMGTLLGGPGRPPCDALCLLRAFLAAPVLGLGEGPTAVHRLLRSNPTFARACGFAGRGAYKMPGELTSRRLPSLSTCEEFNEVMARYGLWQLARVEQVRQNLETGVIQTEDTLAFDTTHIEGNSHCANVPVEKEPADGTKAKHRKVPRVRKNCSCGEMLWDECEHPWTPTDQGAGVVVKGPTRVYWGHKISVVSFGDSEIPLDVRVLQYAAESDGKTLLPHLDVLLRDLPEVLQELRHVVADDAYKANKQAVLRFGEVRLTVPVHPNRRSTRAVAAKFEGINRFTPIGVPICEQGHRFKLLGRDIENERYIWVAPDTAEGQSACAACPLRNSCLTKGKRRHIRTDRADFPQIDWEHPQHLHRNKLVYDKRSGVERAIKRLKVDLGGECLTQRDSHRVQAHIERRLLALHLLLKARAG